MKNFSVNLLKVGMMLIIGLCMMGAMSQVNAAAVLIDEFITEEKIELNVKEEVVLETGTPKKTKWDGKEVYIINDEYVAASELQNMKMELKSENESIATVDSSFKITAKNAGTTTVTLKIGNDYYDEVEVVVKDSNKTSNTTNNSKLSGLGNGLRGILDFIMKVITKIVQPILKAIVNPLANKALQTILPK